MTKPRSHNRNLRWAVWTPQLVVLLLFGFLARLAPLGRYVTADEPNWVYRSIGLTDALAVRDWSAVPATGHPGVTTMWLGVAGVAMRRLLAPDESAAHLEWIRHMAWLAPENGEAFRHLAFFLPFGRVAVALVTTLAMLAIYGLTARLFDRRVAVLAVGLLTFDSFLAGHSGLLHTDALLATFTLLALLAAFNGLQGPHPVIWWVLSGLFTGLALLTKTPALILLPFLLLLLVIHLAQSPTRESLSARRVLGLLGCYSLFLLLVAITLPALSPTLWSDPVQALQNSIESVRRHAATVRRPIFFAGQMTYDPGPAFYPTVLLFRASPVVLIGLVLGLVRVRHLPANRRFAFLALLAFAVLFGTAMSIGITKHDRYLLPAFPPLTLAAALGWGGLRQAVSRWRISPLSTQLLIYSPLLLQITLALLFAAYPLTYFNPIAGGPPIAERVLPVHSGEGMGAAARWLNRLPEADRLTVATADIPSFASLFVGRTVSPKQASLSDYTVHPVPYPPDRSVAHTVRLGLLEHAVVLTNTAPLEQAEYLATRAELGDLILLDAETPLLRRYEGPGTLLSAAGLSNEAAVAVWLTERVPNHGSIWLVASPAASPITAAHLNLQVQRVAAPVSTAVVAAATVTQFAVRGSPVSGSPLSYRAAFGGQLELVDGVLPQTASWPGSLHVTLRWRAVGIPSTDYWAVVQLLDEKGQLWSTTSWPVVNEATFSTSAWAAGEWTDVAYELPLPAGVPPDDYTVEANLYDVVTGAGLGAAGPDGTFQGTQVPVGTVAVAEPVTPPGLSSLEVSERLDLSVGPLTLLGLETPPGQILSGDRLSFSLLWRADAAPNDDYRVRLRLVDSGGEIGLETAVPLCPHPTSHWRVGDWYESRHSLHVQPDVPAGLHRLALNVLDAEDRALWEMDQVLAEVQVLPRERSFELPQDIPHPLDLVLGESLRLLGYRLVQKDALPGGSFSLTLYWQAQGPIDLDYTLFVHLLGPDGSSYGQVDWLDSEMPSSSWAAGQVIVDKIVLPVVADAPPGTYQIAVGFYDAAHGDRLPVADSAGHPLPGDQVLLPVGITNAGGSP